MGKNTKLQLKWKKATKLKLKWKKLQKRVCASNAEIKGFTGCDWSLKSKKEFRKKKRFKKVS